MKFRTIAAFALLIVSTRATGQTPTLYAITMDDLIVIDPANPQRITTIGPHGLPITFNSTTRWGFNHVWGARRLAYHKEANRLVGIHNVARGQGVDQFLVEYDRSTGRATTLVELGYSETVGLIESLVYVDHLATLVITKTSTTSTASFRFFSLALDGTRLLLSRNGRDNDHGAYDPCLGTYYTMDSGVLATVNLATGETTDIGLIHNQSLQMAWGMSDNRLFTTERVGGTLWSIDTGGGTGPLNSTLLGLLNAPVLQGLEYIDSGCYADCDRASGCGTLDIFDFLCFQNAFVAGEPYACDCDTTTGNGVCDIFDFLCFQDAFVAGCP